MACDRRPKKDRLLARSKSASELFFFGHWRAFRALIDIYDEVYLRWADYGIPHQASLSLSSLSRSPPSVALIQNVDSEHTS
jgi:hypothetical protein